MKITNVQRFDRRSSLSDRFIVFTGNDHPRETADKFYFDHNIYDLNFKSNAWNAVIRATTKLTAKKILAHFKTLGVEDGQIVSLQFSHKAGCSCGCSPGFVGKTAKLDTMLDKDTILAGKNIWIEGVEITADERAELAKIIEVQAKKLALEITKHAGEQA